MDDAAWWRHGNQRFPAKMFREQADSHISKLAAAAVVFVAKIQSERTTYCIVRLASKR
jgi:hypothetical protein